VVSSGCAPHTAPGARQAGRPTDTAVKYTQQRETAKRRALCVWGASGRRTRGGRGGRTRVGLPPPRENQRTPSVWIPAKPSNPEATRFLPVRRDSCAVGLCAPVSRRERPQFGHPLSASDDVSLSVRSSLITQTRPQSRQSPSGVCRTRVACDTHTQPGSGSSSTCQSLNVGRLDHTKNTRHGAAACLARLSVSLPAGQSRKSRDPLRGACEYQLDLNGNQHQVTMTLEWPSRRSCCARRARFALAVVPVAVCGSGLRFGARPSNAPTHTATPARTHPHRPTRRNPHRVERDRCGG
jgi:hypothetical protein